jgi:hypothetical protein
VCDKKLLFSVVPLPETINAGRFSTLTKEPTKMISFNVLFPGYCDTDNESNYTLGEEQVCKVINK